MAFTPGNVLVGPCKLFEIDGDDIGGTAGGVTIDETDTTQPIAIDQVVGPVTIALTDRTFVVHTMLAEATLENLKIAWSLSNDPVTNGDGSRTLNLGIERRLNEHELRFVGLAPGGKEREVICHRAMVTAKNAWSMAKDTPEMYDVTFTILPDTSQPDGEEFGAVNDLTSSY